MKPTIVIVGAGSVEFTRELLGDILSFPELGSVRIVLHDIDVERLETAEAIARATARAAGAQPEVVASTDRRRALDGADYVINVIQVGMHEATVRDFEIPAKLRAEPDHRRHHRRRRNLPRPADLPGAGRHRPRHGRRCARTRGCSTTPTRWP